MSLQDRLVDGAQQQRTPSSADSSAMGVDMAKVCCLCGVNVKGRTRFKDSAGRYWCPACNEKDALAKQPAVCPDCHQNFSKADLVDYKGVFVCLTCCDKRKASARREEARLRAVEDEIRQDERRAKRWKVIFGVALVILAAWGLIVGTYSLMVR